MSRKTVLNPPRANIRTPAWIDLDRRHVWHPFTQVLTADPPIPITRAQGVLLFTADGRTLIDGISSWWVNIHGHSHPRLARALANQAAELSQVIFAGLTHEPAARLAEALVGHAPPELNRVFYTDDGSTAVEIAMKMAFQLWHNRGEPQRKLFVALDHAYHGDTFGAMAVGAGSVFHAAFEPLLFDVRRAHAPYCLHCPLTLKRDCCGVACAQSLEETLERDGDRIAAVIIEPMLQGAGGMITWPKAFLRRVREATRRAGIPLIADEVLTGFGRTGKMFACEHGPIAPDIMCLSKALTGGVMPLAATLTSDEVYEAFLSTDRTRTLFHGHSYTGNALACAVALESLALFEEEHRLQQVARLQELFADRLAPLQNHAAVAETRAMGAVAAIELHPSAEKGAEDGGYLDSRGPLLARACIEQGVLLRPLGNVLYFMPPYVITEEQVHQAFDAISTALDSIV